MNEREPTTKQVIAFTVLLSFIASILGTILTIGVLGPVLGWDQDGQGGPLIFNKPKLLEKITETVLEKETVERIERADELVVKVVESASPAVVSIVATKDVPVIEKFFVDPFAGDPFFKQFFGEGGSGFQVPQFRQKGTERREVSSGTGFIVSKDGLVITNKHVVSDADAQFTALLNDGSKRNAKVLARDPLHDLAVLKIDGEGYSPLPLGDSTGVKIGQTAVAIGNALGEFRNTVSVGVVSGLQRTVIASNGNAEPETLQELIQTDAAINPGNSGGPLINIRGEVIGVNTAVASGAENIGFAIPVNQAKTALQSVQKTGKIIYPFLGVRYTVITRERAEKEKLPKDYGVLVSDGPSGEAAIVAGSPAEKAGIKKGDIILEIQGERIDQTRSLSSILQKYHVGDEIALKIFRGEKEIELKTTLTERKI
ncbi:MAG: Protease Do [Parcubacteria group bacterium GW2011_GWB1_50_9]|nr:MAG: Protease Do [Parcubacteria group bacterium GW2011_GWB1_50_9]